MTGGANEEGARAAKTEAARIAGEARASGAPQRWTQIRVLGVGALWASFGVAACVALSPVLGVVLIGLGALLLVAGVRGLRALRGASLLAAAANELDRGRFAVALELLGELDPRALSPAERRAVRYQRGYAALVRGDPKTARAELEAARDVAESPFTIVSLHRANGLSCAALGALAAALDGDDAAAKRDIELVREAVATQSFGRTVVANEVWMRRLLALVTLAEALVLARSNGAGEELVKHLEANRAVLIEGLVPRERALYRGLVRLARETKRSAYREPPTPPRDLDAPSPEAWVAALAPNVAPFVDPASQRRVVEAPPGAEDRPRRPAVPPARPSAERVAAKMKLVFLWIAIAAVFFVAWQLLDVLAPSAAEPQPVVAPVDLSFFTTVLPPLLVAVLAALMAFRVSRTARRARIANRAMLELALGVPITTSDHATARGGAMDLIGMMRHAASSRVAFAQARFEDALASADAAFASAPRAQSQLTGESQGMLSEARARALAALGRADEARGEVASWPSDYSHRAAGAVAVELLAALREGDEAEAHAVATRVNDELSLDARTEALVDLLRAKRGAIGLVDRGRLAEDVRRPDLRRFLLAVAPELLDDFERESVEDAARDAEAEAEAEADAEAERAARGDAARIDRG